ncbi:hypothetical protein ABZK21_003176 [Salmonella enterica]|uniref:HEAT repeat domain-containing protein n=1 Tax=Salmonella enterica I TaxID=59201 RepID=A0A5U3S189_SALET|nr:MULTISPECIES: hypothetical protein [Enterobacteriaceae]EBP6617682.1 hypothetical protein [Salmonella enterica subsp. enterica]HCR0942279.1 hypothetical protein [Enterobacter hormaechei]MCK7452767.1 hypothetical protein [Enterobacter chengduensis]MXV04105.1 hypothetical protein [Enterobacter sp. ABFQC]UQQ31332.1 hypothetical protein M1V99_03245 [Enterobacter bugandensis]
MKNEKLELIKNIVSTEVVSDDMTIAIMEAMSKLGGQEALDLLIQFYNKSSKSEDIRISAIKSIGELPLPHKQELTKRSGASFGRLAFSALRLKKK